MFFGVDISRSFWSSQERMTGVLTIIHFWLWFLILTSTFKEWKDWQKLIWASLIACFLVGLYDLGQKMGLKFLLKETDVRMGATLGNPIYLGTYSMLHIFLIGFLFLKDKKWLWRGLEIFLLIFNLIIVFLTASRGVLVAFSPVFLFFIIYSIFVLSSKKIKLILAPIFILLIIFIISGTIFLQTQKYKSWIKNTPLFIRRTFHFLSFSLSFFFLGQFINLILSHFNRVVWGLLLWRPVKLI